MVGKWSLGKKRKNEELGKKNEKRERKREENYIKKGKKTLKMHLFGLCIPLYIYLLILLPHNYESWVKTYIKK